MNPVPHAPRLPGRVSLPAGAEEAWPGDELEADWGQGWSPDLEPGLHAGLVVLVVLAHVMLAWVVLGRAVSPSRDTPPRLITAQVLSEAAPAPASTRAESPARPAEPAEPAEPAQAPAVAQARRPRPAPVPAPLLAAPKAPTPPARTSPPTESKPSPAAMPAPVAPSNQPAPQSSPQPAPQAAAPAPAPSPNPSPVSAGAATSPAPGADPPRSVGEPKELPISQVRYLSEPRAVYPRASLELGETGVVKVRVLVDEEGRPRTVQITRSSGFPRLDRQAIQTMNAARFQPHMEGGVPRAVWVSTEVTFKLD